MSLSCRPAARLLIRPHGNHVLLTNNLFTSHPNIPSSFFLVCISGLQLSTPLWGSPRRRHRFPCPAKRLHSPVDPPPSRPAVALTGRDCWRSPDRSLASGRQPAPTRSLHEGQSDAGEWTLGHQRNIMRTHGAADRCAEFRRDCSRLHHCLSFTHLGETTAVRYAL